MAINKKCKKQLLKQLNKTEKKQYKSFINDISDEILKFYSETVRLKTIPGISKEYTSICIGDTMIDLAIHLELKERYKWK